ncbi:hypothetical protein LCGC14_2947250, partial [marine sediment metagenome]
MVLVFGGGGGSRTPDTLRAKQVLSQLSYAPVCGAAPLRGLRGHGRCSRCLLWIGGTHGARTRHLPVDNRLRYQLRQRPVDIGTAVGIGAGAGRVHRAFL